MLFGYRHNTHSKSVIKICKYNKSQVETTICNMYYKSDFHYCKLKSSTTLTLIEIVYLNPCILVLVVINMNINNYIRNLES